MIEKLLCEIIRQFMIFLTGGIYIRRIKVLFWRFAATDDVAGYTKVIYKSNVQGGGGCVGMLDLVPPHPSEDLFSEAVYLFLN